MEYGVDQVLKTIRSTLMKSRANTESDFKIQRDIDTLQKKINSMSKRIDYPSLIWYFACLIIMIRLFIKYNTYLYSHLIIIWKFNKANSIEVSFWVANKIDRSKQLKTHTIS